MLNCGYEQGAMGVAGPPDGRQLAILPRTSVKTRFILVETSHAGNVGGVARAMKTMGFTDLVLVRPRWANVLRREETIQRASGALDVLTNCRVVDTFEEAAEGCSHLFATAMTPRDFGPPTLSPRDAFLPWAQQARPQTGATAVTAPADQLLFNVEQTNTVDTGQSANLPDKVAFLFGSERFGMANEDVYRCHTCLRIPTDPNFGSLNLAAAVQVVAYEWRTALGGFDLEPQSSPALADAAAIQGALAHWQEALVAIDFLDPQAPKKLLPRLNSLLNRAALREEEVHILRGMAKAVLKLAGAKNRT
jgi:tRNA/rRNA methyltransferase